MNAILILFIVGTILLSAEVFLPGAVAGIIGGLALLAGSVLSFRTYGVSGGLVASGGALGLLVITLYAELVWLPKTAWGKRLVVQARIDGQSQPPQAELSEVLNKPAEALTTLAPSGYVLVEGRRYEAYCRSGLVPKGTALRVTGLDNFRLIVTTL